MNLFGDMGGIDAIREFLTQDTSNIERAPVPIVYVEMILGSITNFYNKTVVSIQPEIMYFVKESITARIESITEQEAKDIEVMGRFRTTHSLI